MWYGCPKCRTEKIEPNIITEYDFDSVNNVLSKEIIIKRRGMGVWKYKELMPILNKKNMVTLYEGDTPLIKCDKIGNSIGLNNLYVKVEGRNPTGSYKDRLIAVSASKAKEVNAKFMISHGGNTGAPCAAYANRVGLPAISVESPTVIRGEISNTIALGGKSVIFEEDTSAAKRKMMMESVNNGGYSVSPVGTHGVGEPYGHDGLKTIGYEMCEQLGWRAPDWIISPTGAAAGNLFGAWQGCSDYNKLDYVENLPHMVAAQTAAAAPLVKAIVEKLDYVPYVTVKPTHIGKAVDSTSSYKGLVAVRDSRGTAVAISDKDAWEMERNLALMEGIYAGSISGAAIASAKALKEEGKIDKQEIVVCTLTSHGQWESDRIIAYNSFKGGGKGQLPEPIMNYQDMVFKGNATWENIITFLKIKHNVLI